MLANRRSCSGQGGMTIADASGSDRGLRVVSVGTGRSLLQRSMPPQRGNDPAGGTSRSRLPWSSVAPGITPQHSGLWNVLLRLVSRTRREACSRHLSHERSRPTSRRTRAGWKTARSIGLPWTRSSTERLLDRIREVAPEALALLRLGLGRGDLR